MRLLRFAPAIAFVVLAAACVSSQSGDSDSSGAPTTAFGAPIGSLQGARTFDWSSDRVTGRATQGVSPDVLLEANLGARPAFAGAPSTLVTTGSAITASAAVYGASWVESTPNASDMLFFGVNGTGSTAGINGGVYTNAGTATTAPAYNLFGLTNLYASTGSPVLAWYAALPGGIDRSAIALSGDGTKVYAVDTTGVLHCLLRSSSGVASNCSTLGTGWTDFSTGCASGVHGSSPWVSFTNGDIYFGDMCSQVHHVNATTGKDCWNAYKPGPSATYQTSFESSPVVVNGYVYIGDDMGQLFRITDTTDVNNCATQSNPTTVAIFDTCTAIGQSAPCPDSGSHPWAIRAPVAFDVPNSHVYAVADDYVFELNGSSGNWAQTSASPKHLSSGVDGSTNGPMLSATLLDFTSTSPYAGLLYTGFNSKVFKLSFPFSGTSTANLWSQALAAGAGAQNPNANVIVYNNVTYVGDTAGYAEQYSCTSGTGAPQLDGQSPNLGSSITASGVIDYSTGNINFGLTTSGGGALMQFPLAVTSSAWSCPSGQKLCSSTNGPANTCTAADGVTNYGNACHACCVNGDCSSGSSCIDGVCTAGCTGGPSAPGSCATMTNATATCSAASGGTCSYTCNSGFANCNGTIATVGCTTVTTTDPNNCGGCGNACSGNNIPNPTCTAGVCNGHCADGYVDCDGNRLTNGCESTAACGTGGCCGNTCATGTVCYDTGSTGVCANGQTTEASGTNSQNNTVAVTCPAGQLITSITFADFGTPGGVGGQSWSTTNNCSTATTSGTCTATGCRWNGAACVAYSCETLVTSSKCGAQTGCTWVAATGTCTASACASATSSATCAAVTSTSCQWNSALGTCTSNLGFLHEYGTSAAGTNKYPPSCALDISGDSVVTNGCLFNVNSCSFTASTGTFGTGTNTASGATLPLTTTPPNPSGYPSDPCPSFTKRLYVEATCGFCENECTSNTQCGSGTCTNGRCVTPGCAPNCTNNTGCNVNSDCASGICANNVCAAPTCSPSCSPGSTCGASGDCGSGVCTSGRCTQPSCSPNCTSGQSCGTSGDCGSGVCACSGSPATCTCTAPSCSPTCGDGASCGANSDCSSGVCTNGRCAIPTCSPNCGASATCATNADCNSGVCTCSGSPATCKCTTSTCSPTCGTDAQCGSNSDCGSGTCTNGRCVLPSCSPTCAVGQGCGSNGDCASYSCVSGKCADVSCAPTCQEGAECATNADCASGTCMNKKCVAPSCSPSCADGHVCGQNADCGSNVCTCTSSTCTCSAPACASTCAIGADCGANSDCASGTCTNGRCTASSGCTGNLSQGTACTANGCCASNNCSTTCQASASCSPNCATGATCGQNGDCQSQSCVNNKCASPSCAPTCNQGNRCSQNSDCTSGVCTSGSCAASSCSPSCADGKACGQNGDCASQSCTNGVCVAPSCAPTCNQGNQCGANSDCGSDVCTNKACAAPSCSPNCTQGQYCGQNGDCATQICTHNACAAQTCAPTCNQGNRCGANSDCGSNVCTSGSCAAPSCSPNCTQGKYCGQNGDCATQICTHNVCAAASCAPTCNDGNRCGANSDCASSNCVSESCTAPSCASSCADGQPCGQNGDCASQVCHNGTCEAPSCSPDCTNGQRCGADGDCGSDVCSGGTCQSPTCASTCATNSPCGANSDCKSGTCTNGYCK